MNLRRGDRIVAVYMNGDGEVKRGCVGSRQRGLKSAYSAEEPLDAWLNFLNPEAEGIVWARGWNSKAANALRVAVALES